MFRIANREDPDLIRVCAVGLGHFGGQLVLEILEHLPYFSPLKRHL